MWLTISVAVVWAIVLAGAGGLLTTIGPWYRALRKPSWQPPDWAFGPAWTLILGMAAASGVLAWNNAGPNGGAVLAYFGVISAFHLLWSPLFFTWHRPDWALIEIPFLWVALIVAMIGLTPISAVSSWLLAPFFAWVTFAARLNLEIVRLNGPFGVAARDVAAQTPVP